MRYFTDYPVYEKVRTHHFDEIQIIFRITIFCGITGIMNNIYGYVPLTVLSIL